MTMRSRAARADMFDLPLVIAIPQCKRALTCLIHHALSCPKTLLGHGVPVIITSGCPQGPGTWPELCDVIWLEKPVDPARLLALIERVAPALAHGLRSPVV